MSRLSLPARALVVVVLAVACSPERAGSPTVPDVPNAPVAPAADDGTFRVAVLLGATRMPAPDDARRVFGLAQDILFQKTGARMSEFDLVTVPIAPPFWQAVSYVANSTSPPDGVLAFADDSAATTFGGYSETFSLGTPHVNRFPSPVMGENQGYLAVVDFFHKYARCGYDGSGNRVSDRSFGGECRNQAGLACVDNGRYWTCPDSLHDLYSEPDYFTACTVVHEFMHPFGSEGNLDHYGTAQCSARTGMSPAEALNRTGFQQSCGMCPDLFGKFRHR
jgi:hypothetical protein